MINTMEKIMNTPEKNAYYNADPILKATFMAVYEYKKQGFSLKDLGWFLPIKEKKKND